MSTGRDHNRLGFAVQLTTVRFLGTFLHTAGVPRIVVDYVTGQLSVRPSLLSLLNYIRAEGLARNITEGQTMSLLHISINACDPEGVANFLAKIMGGVAMPFPPFPDCWIAFTTEDDGTAIEVYPTTHVLEAGPEQISCEVKTPDNATTFVHAAIGTKLSRTNIVEIASTKGWISRICNRGPFECVEVWLENRLLVELLDAEMQKDYRIGMTASNWASMFGFSR